MALATGSYGWVHGRHLSRQHVRPGDFSIGVPRAPISCPSFPRGSKSLPKRCVVMVKLEIPLVISRPDRRVLGVGPSKAPSSSSSNPWNECGLYSNPVGQSSKIQKHRTENAPSQEEGIDFHSGLSSYELARSQISCLLQPRSSLLVVLRAWISAPNPSPKPNPGSPKLRSSSNQP